MSRQPEVPESDTPPGPVNGISSEAKTSKSSIEEKPAIAPGSSPQPGSDGALRGTSQVTTSQPGSQSELEDVTKDVLPANVGDLPSRVDTLGFTPYVDAIAAFLTNKVTKPPLTLSIEGEWGSGKSSFMLQLREQLKSKMSVVDFNAWRYDKDEAMWAAFALEFARKLRIETPWYVRPWAHLKFFFRRFDWTRGWPHIVRLLSMVIIVLLILALPILMWENIRAFATSSDSLSTYLTTTVRAVIGAGGALGYLVLVGFLLLKAKDMVGGPLKINLKEYLDTPDYKSRVAFIDQFHQDFKKVAEIYGRKKKVCVFIDDLDRCEVPKAADLMQALNLMISDDEHSQLIFIMGMDREKVAAGLAVKHEKLLPYLAPAPAGNGSQANAAFDPVLGLEYGYGFIEKFIQLPFQVPQAGKTQMDEFLKRLLGDADSASPEQKATSDQDATAEGERAETAVTEDLELVTDILKMVAPTLEYNPRRLKQFINAFRLKTFIASKLHLFKEPADADKYNKLTVEQIGKFVAITLRWPLLLADLDNERDLLSRLQILVLNGKLPSDLYDVPNRKVKAELTTEAGKKVTITKALYRWFQRDNLRRLLAVKLFTDDGSRVDDEMERIYSLAQLDVDKLLEISPLTGKPSQTTSSDVDDLASK